MKKSEMISYWTKSSDKDYQAMIHLFEKGHYTWSLFIGHLVIEKLLKAIYSQKYAENPPFIHDLYRLSEKCHLELDDEQKDNLDTISTFNIQARYDDYKMEFHNKCTKVFSQKWIDTIKELRAWFKEHHLRQS
ncbi:HEPN domain-containing protein [Thermodesulfobacteriota bacterium]